ncbi:H-type lectin domain-containing protein [Pseudorhodobacter sp.]|uniref:H-type lectin domain-containing protein n=1 Tax=Pseudorhodobacter sp. TaxID=1934400 RepID=UPI0026478934|nr:H-type lectin domain-containing protein [Pseudorhodobacter sp.]MDN5788759.1 H-type lectin domain-containing protein [Pseudorhodobacter sp.]
MKKFPSQRIGVDQGSRVLFSDFADGGAMWTGSGPRESRHIVKFTESFVESPAVTVAMTMWDMDQKTNSRADLSAEKITPSGFHLVFKTWGDTRVARVRADWMAIGRIVDDEDWELY